MLIEYRLLLHTNCCADKSTRLCRLGCIQTFDTSLRLHDLDGKIPALAFCLCTVVFRCSTHKRHPRIGSGESGVQPCEGGWRCTPQRARYGSLRQNMPEHRSQIVPFPTGCSASCCVYDFKLSDLMTDDGGGLFFFLKKYDSHPFHFFFIFVIILCNINT